MRKRNPTLALGPDNTLIAVWQAARGDQEGTPYLYTAVYPPVTKHYYAGGRLIASRINGVVRLRIRWRII